MNIICHQEILEMLASLPPKVHRARDVAMAFHEGQMYGPVPYVQHLDHVVWVLISHEKTGEVLLIAAYLHDVLNETEMSGEELTGNFGKDTYNVVRFCTEDPALLWVDRLKHSRIKMKQCLESNINSQRIQRRVRTLKFADRMANVQACLLWKDWTRLYVYAHDHEDFVRIMYCDEVRSMCSSLRMVLQHYNLLPESPLWKEISEPSGLE